MRTVTYKYRGETVSTNPLPDGHKTQVGTRIHVGTAHGAVIFEATSCAEVEGGEIVTVADPRCGRCKQPVVWSDYSSK